jgi:uncharacterized protein (DUF952 family)
VRVTTLFHITTHAAWGEGASRGTYEGDTLRSQGFIHCSTEPQVVEVADRLFRGRTDLLLLVIDAAAISPEVRYENLEGGAEQYPHVYGPLNRDAVTGTLPLPPGPDGRFTLPV